MYPARENEQRLQRAQRLADELKLTLTQVSLGYLLSQPFACIPVVGCHTQDQLRDSLSAAEVMLTPEQVQYLESEE